MSNNTPPPADHLPEWYDPFPEPQTVPSGWDLSEFGYAQHDASKTSETQTTAKVNP